MKRTIHNIRYTIIMAGDNNDVKHRKLVSILPKLEGDTAVKATVWIADHEKAQAICDKRHAQGLIQTAGDTMQCNQGEYADMLRAALENVTGQVWIKG